MAAGKMKAYCSAVSEITIDSTTAKKLVFCI